MDAAFLLPEHTHRYRLLQPLGSGGAADVYAALRHPEGTLCVIKRLRERAEPGSLLHQRFEREARLAARLEHPHLCSLLDVALDGPHPFLVFEYINGVPLAELSSALQARGHLIPYGVSLTIGAQILSALDYIHRARDEDGPMLLVHRDISPRNIMLDHRGHARLIDFGVAKTRSKDALTAPGVLLGTLRYLSPEQAEGEPVDARSDLYTVGVVLYELLSGVRLTPEANPITVLYHIMNVDPPPLESTNPLAPKGLSAVLARALAKRRQDRWQTAAEFRSALMAAAGPQARLEPAWLATFLTHYFAENVAQGERLRTQVQKRGESTLHLQPEEPSLLATWPSPPPEMSYLGEAITRVTEVSRLAPTRLVQPATKSKPRVGGWIGLGVVLLAAAYGLGRWQGRAERSPPAPQTSPQPAPEAPLTPTVVARPPAPVTTVSEPSSILEPKPKAKVDPPKPAQPPPPDPLQEALRALRQAPTDRDRFLALHGRLEQTAQRLPAEQRQRVRALLMRAQLSLDPEDLAAALNALQNP